MNLVFFKFLCNIFFKYLTRGRVQYVGDMFSVSLSKGVGVLVREDEEMRLRVQVFCFPASFPPFTYPLVPSTGGVHSASPHPNVLIHTSVESC